MKKIIFLSISLLICHSVLAQKLDRSLPPKPGPAPVISFSDPVTFKLPNGITALVVEDHKLPRVSASYSIDAGPRVEGSKAGVLSLLGSMLNEGTTTKSRLQFNRAVDQVGASLSIRSNGASVTALTRYFKQSFSLMSEALRHPALQQAALDKLKSQMLTSIKSNERSASAISGRVVNALVYGKTHPMGEFITEQTLSSITLEDIKLAYANNITPSRGYLTIVGDITPTLAKSIAVEALGDWKGTALVLPRLASVNNPSKTEVDVVDLKNAVQAEISVTNLISLPLSSPDYHALLIANQILGGGADSKLFRNLREKHGFTYGAYSNVGAGRFQTTFVASAAVRTEKVDSAVAEIFREIQVMRTTKVSAEVLQNAKNLYNGAFALGLESAGRTAAFASDILINNLPKDFYRTYLQKINAVTAEDILRVSAKYLTYDQMRVVIVGNSDGFMKGLGTLGYPIKKYTSYGDPVQ